MVFKKGTPPWNKGLTKETDERIMQMSKKVSNTTKGHKVGWSKGLTKYTHPGVMANSIAHRKENLSNNTRKMLSDTKKGDLNPAKRRDVRDKMSQARIKYLEDHPNERRMNGKYVDPNYFTYHENIMANALTGAGYKFSHNYGLGKYTVDFVINNRYIIECDGYRHDYHRDPIRDDFLVRVGYIVMHILHVDIEKNISKCLSNINKMIAIDNVLECKNLTEHLFVWN